MLSPRISLSNLKSERSDIGLPGVMLGVIALGVIEGVCAPGVSSHRDLLLLAPGVGVSCMRSPPRSVLGVSAHPLPCPGVSVKNQITCTM